MAKSKYTLPKFKFYKPQKLERTAKRIEQETDKRLTATGVSKNRYERTLGHLRENRNLRQRHYKILAYYLSSLKEDYPKLYNLFISKAQDFFSGPGRYYYHLKALLSSYYQEFKDKELYNLINLVIKNNNKWKSEMEFVKNLLYKSNNANEFFFKIVSKVNDCRSLTDIEELKSKLLMNNNNNLLKQSLSYYWLQILDNGVRNINNDLCIQIIKDYIPLEKKKKLFEKVLLDNKDINNFDSIGNIFERWLKLIGNTLGGPYGSNSAKWANIDQEARDLFKRWKAHKNIIVTFGEISGDQRRLDFWKQYSDYFYRVEYFEKYDQAILMESSNHIFIEFAGGGALYMYNKDYLTIQNLIDKECGYSNTKMVSEVLKDTQEEECTERLEHRDNYRGYKKWEPRFFDRFSTHGYVKKSSRKK